MDATTSAILRKISVDLKPLQNLNNPFYYDPNFLGAFLVSIVALAIALFSEPLKNLWKKTDLTVQGILTNKQGNGNSIYYRISIINNGNYPARDVEAYIDNIYEDNKERKNFLPVPLRWTHARAYTRAGVYRDIHPNQSVLLDFCELVKDRNLLHLSLAAGGEVPEYSILHGGNTKMVLKMYQENGKTIIIKLKIDWQSGRNPTVSLY